MSVAQSQAKRVYEEILLVPSPLHNNTTKLYYSTSANVLQSNEGNLFNQNQIVIVN